MLVEKAPCSLPPPTCHCAARCRPLRPSACIHAHLRPPCFVCQSQVAEMFILQRMNKEFLLYMQANYDVVWTKDEQGHMTATVAPKMQSP